MTSPTDQPDAAANATSELAAPDPSAKSETDEGSRSSAPATPRAPGSARRRAARRFGAAFVFGALGVLALSAGALAAFESSNAGRILPGVHVGEVDLSGLTASDARARLNDAYASLAEGELRLEAGGTVRTISYASVGRRLDVDAAVEAALLIGRNGPTLDRIAANLRNMIRGIEIAPMATFERGALRLEVQKLAADVEVAPVDAIVALAGEAFAVTDGADGRTANADAALRASTTLLADVNTPAKVRITVPLEVVAPDVTTAEATAARDAATRIAVDLNLVNGDEKWLMAGTSIRGWITFGPSADGGFGPIVAQTGLEAGLAAIAGDVAIAPVDASFLIGDGQQVVGVTEAKLGRALDVAGTVAKLAKVIEQRVDGLDITGAPVITELVEPGLTTEEATATAPLMRKISEHTTWFPIGIKNGQGANIWIPARDIDGYVLLPGANFDFWQAIGPVTRERGYKDGGVIINGKTEPQGALAGGICSCSTTLFNAAAKAGLEMGARRNHFYYIDRYPLGLDATVFQSSSGSIQTMSFRNDTENPILIRGLGWSEGSRGYVKFELWSVPTEREVTFSKPIVKNVKPASDSTVETTDLEPGVRERIEYPVDGKDVWVTRTVKDAQGNVLHREEYYSHYARITGIVRIGIAAPPPSPTPTPPAP